MLRCALLEAAITKSRVGVRHSLANRHRDQLAGDPFRLLGAQQRNWVRQVGRSAKPSAERNFLLCLDTFV
jgi:hypothetical protein